MAKASEDNSKLTEHEGMLLALVWREQPVTAYQLYKIFERSPVTSINASKGQLYPAIKRLKQRGLLKSRRVSSGRRNAEELSTTELAKGAVRAWIKGIDNSHVVLDDPLRTRMLSLEALTREERLAWIAQAKALVKARREAIDKYDKTISVPYQEFAYRSAIESLRVKMDWLDELLYHIASSS
jgi:DNA-binding PadR family transcriptional regulator